MTATPPLPRAPEACPTCGSRSREVRYLGGTAMDYLEGREKPCADSWHDAPRADARVEEPARLDDSAKAGAEVAERAFLEAAKEVARQWVAFGSEQGAWQRAVAAFISTYRALDDSARG